MPIDREAKNIKINLYSLKKMAQSATLISRSEYLPCALSQCGCRLFVNPSRASGFKFRPFKSRLGLLLRHFSHIN